jgi:hypothetical protein
MQTTTDEVRTVVPTGCCAPFDPALRNDREVVWRDRLFVREHVKGFLHVPLNLGKTVANATQDMARYAASKGRAIDKLYFGYTTCPKCAKAYGHNHVVLFARVADASRPS